MTDLEQEIVNLLLWRVAHIAFCRKYAARIFKPVFLFLWLDISEWPITTEARRSAALITSIFRQPARDVSLQGVEVSEIKPRWFNFCPHKRHEFAQILKLCRRDAEFLGRLEFHGVECVFMQFPLSTQVLFFSFLNRVKSSRCLQPQSWCQTFRLIRSRMIPRSPHRSPEDRPHGKQTHRQKARTAAGPRPSGRQQ